MAPIVTPSASAATPPPGVEQVAGGSRHSIALKTDGTVWAWGDNSFGQLGDGTERSSALPVRVANLSGITAIAAGDWHGVAVRGDGTVWAWGRNNAGQLGNGTTTSSLVPVQVSSLTDAVWVAAGGSHSLALRSNQTVRAWGANSFGQLGDGTTTNRTTPVTVSGLSSVVDLSAGEAHSLALRNDWTVRSWGRNSSGQLGDGTTTNRTTPVTVSGLSSVGSIAAGGNHSVASRFADNTARAWGSNLRGQLGDGTTLNRTTPVTVIGATGVGAVAAGFEHSFARRGSDTLAWGRNLEGQLGDGTKTSRSSPVAVSHVAPAELDGGRFHTVALVGDTWSGDTWAYAWGENLDGQVGDVATTMPGQAVGPGPTQSPRLTPWRVFGLTGFTAVSAGETHSLVRRFDGTVWAAGNNVDGELGTGDTAPSSTLVQVKGLTQVREISAGGFHSLALRSDGTVRAWGHNGLGQVGDGTTINRQNATSVAGLTDVVAVAAGRLHSLALRSDGTVWGWGYNFWGQLGDGTTALRKEPVQASGLTDVVLIAAGDDHSLAVKADGSMWAWGANDSGQLGDGTAISATTPVRVGPDGALEIVAGRKFSLATFMDGSVFAWGANDSGQLGIGAAGALSTVPVPVGIGSAAVSDAWRLGAGSFHAAVLRRGGTVAGWGFNAYGQVGDGTKADRSAPRAVHGLRDVHKLAQGAFHGLAITGDGSLWGWGAGVDGQLANGTAASPAAPHLAHPLATEDFVVTVDTPVLEAPPGQGASASVTVTTNSMWAPGPVSVAVTGVPPGSTATLSPAGGTVGPASSWAATLSVSTALTQTQEYSLTLEACGAGVCHSVPVAVAVTPLEPLVGSYASEVLSDRPTSYWRLDETTGSTAEDEQGSNPGAVIGGVTSGSSPAVGDGHAMSFNGLTGYVDLKRPSNLATDSFTIEAWIRPAGLTSTQRVVYRAGSLGAGLRLTTANVLEGFFHVPALGATPVVVPGPPITATTWHHVAFTKDDHVAVLYVDGVAVSTVGVGSTGTLYSLGKVTIGRDGDVGAGYFHGLIDEVAVYDDALTPTRIATHYRAARG